MIEVNELSKSYRERIAIQNIHFKVAKGEVLGFLGPNGAGKSTTMKILSGILRANSGSAKVNGYDVAKDSRLAKASLGFLPETPPVYASMEVETYLQFAAQLRHVEKNKLKKAVMESMEKCGIAGVRERIIGNLSKGYRQRVGIAQAIVHNPPVLILDEPTVGLDPKQIIEIRNLIRSFAGSHTVVLSTHILSEVNATCDRVVVIDQGKIVAEDTLEGLSHRMNTDHRICLRTKIIREEAIAKIQKIPGVQKVHWEKVNAYENYSEFYRIIVSGKSKENICPELAEICVSENLKLLELREEQVSLEEAFVRLIS